MIIGITINNVLRNHIDKVIDAYQTVTGKEPITPINPFELDKSFPNIDVTTSEVEFNPDNQEVEFINSEIDTSFDVYEFMYHDASFEVFGRADQSYDNILTKLSDLQDSDLQIVLINKETRRSKCATLFFLSKNNFDFPKIIFPDNYKDFWKHCDVLVTDNPKILKYKRKKKILVKIENNFNIDYKSDFSIINITELPNIIEDIKKIYNDKKIKL
jgi:hypothetical protein